MNITLYMSHSKRETLLSDALTKGFRRHGLKVGRISNSEEIDPTLDLAVFVGVKSRRLYRSCIQAGVIPLLIDKGYFRNKEYYRASLGGYQPPYLLDMRKPPDRLNKFGVLLHPRRIGGSRVIFAGSSRKYCDFHELGDVNDYARRVCAELYFKLQGKKRIIYRPKPSWWANHGAYENKLDGGFYHLPPHTEFSSPNELLSHLLPDAHCLVTHGSNAAVDALIAGVPVILLSKRGVSPVYDLCDHSIENVLSPRWVCNADRLAILSNLAHCQFTPAEMADGTMWSELKQWYGYKIDNKKDPSNEDIGSN